MGLLGSLLEVEAGGGGGFGDLVGFGDGLAGEGVGAFDGDCFFVGGGGGGGWGWVWVGGCLRGGVWRLRGVFFWSEVWCCGGGVFCYMIIF